MGISILTLYTIASSCFTLLIGKSFAATLLPMDNTLRQNDRRETNMQFQNEAKTNSIEILIPGKTGENLPTDSNMMNFDKASDYSIQSQNESHSYFALFDPVRNITKKWNVKEASNNLPSIVPGRELDNLKRVKNGRRMLGNQHPWDSKSGNFKIRNFIVWDNLQDSENEVRIFYKGITAKETTVKTGIDEETGQKLGLKLRQLTDGTHFIQLIYTFDDIIQDCEYIRQKKIIRKFLGTFKEDVEKAKLTNEINEELKKKGNDVEREDDSFENYVDDDDDEDNGYVAEDEGKIERYSMYGEYAEDDNYSGSEFKNVTFQIVQDDDSLPREFSEWMNYKMLKQKCKETHKILKQLAFDKANGDERAKQQAKEHFERMKRSLKMSLIFPGTKWCGKGSEAEKYTELGVFSKTDKCCRAHDNCDPMVFAFEKKFEFQNDSPFTISHCRCDRRRKRDLMHMLLVPGTKWCGKGRTASKYTSLGGFSRTDKCCRIHDTMCPHWIGGLESKYGFFNWRINTIMHCRCDKRFRACLKMAKTATANFVGKIFFNVVQTKCFILKPKKVCLNKSTWWHSVCEKNSYEKRAILQNNPSY